MATTSSRQCLGCGSTNLQSGNLFAGAGPVHVFRPSDMKLLTLLAGAAVNAFVCVDCGAVGMWTDPDEVRALPRHPPTNT